jgi:hypothetical protein
MINGKFDFMKSVFAAAPEDLGDTADVGGGLLCAQTCSASCPSTCQITSDNGH